MSLNWQWTDKMGEVIFQNCDTERPFKTNIYQGNALMIWVNEFPEGTYSVGSFFCDQEHLRNMLGLNAKKGYGSENLLNTWKVKTIRLNTRYKSVPKILSDLAKAKTNVSIELYEEPELRGRVVSA